MNLNDLKAQILAGRLPVSRVATYSELTRFDRLNLLRAIRREADELLNARNDVAKLVALVAESEREARLLEGDFSKVPAEDEITAMAASWVTYHPGDFIMGSSDEGAFHDERPRRKCFHSGFAIRAYPVMVHEFTQFIEDHGYSRRSLWDAGGFGKWEPPLGWEDQVNYASRPVTGVSWFEAAAFAAWANARLPREIEWERSARGSSGRMYPWGNSKPTPQRLNCRGSAINHLTPVDTYVNGATPDGVFDLVGNCGEWCCDKYADRQSGGLPKVGNWRVIRGGSFREPASCCRATSRGKGNSYYRYADVGFRLAR